MANVVVRISTDTGCAGCRRVEERFNVKNTHTHILKRNAGGLEFP